MQVILMEKIDNLGSLGEIVNVKSGFARNFLVPQKKAKLATKTNVEEFETIRADLEKVQADASAAAQARLKDVEGIELTIEVRAGQEGKLFGSVSNHNIMEALNEKGANVELREIRMPDGPIRNLGDFEIGVHLHSDVDTTVKVSVVPDADSETEVIEKQPIGTFVDDDDDY